MPRRTRRGGGRIRSHDVSNASTSHEADDPLGEHELQDPLVAKKGQTRSSRVREGGSLLGAGQKNGDQGYDVRAFTAKYTRDKDEMKASAELAGTSAQSGGLHAGANLVTAEQRVNWGNGKYGAGGDAKVVHSEVGYGDHGDKDPGYGGADADALGAGYTGEYDREEGMSAGAGAYLAQASGNAGYGKTKHDTNVRAGAAVGVGAAGRSHWGDADGDGVREVGFGADIGPVTFDVKSETLGHAAKGVKKAGKRAGKKLKKTGKNIKKGFKKGFKKVGSIF